MKITRHKKVHKYLSFFCNNFGFRQPYQVLIDGTFCYAALKNQVNIREQIPKYLEAEVKLLTTQCVIIEAEKLGSSVFGALMIVKQFGTHKCGHIGKPVPASVCLLSMLGGANSNRYFVATQDRELQKSASTIPGTPVLFLHQKTPTLQPPSEISTAKAKKHTMTLFDVRKHEEESFKTLRKKFGVLEKEDHIKKRKKKKGPNPLSCKKKQKKSVVVEQHKEEFKKKRKRKRVKIPTHLKEHWIAQLKNETTNVTS
uniref:rRNA-processing protein UTP23 homolog n=1 Tax=Timema shepardi TaxID=629360 RepID=A0A7R9ATU6_TIMSH|nr:unnamed protein product [Timema shepardi]